MTRPTSSIVKTEAPAVGVLLANKILRRPFAELSVTSAFVTWIIPICSESAAPSALNEIPEPIPLVPGPAAIVCSSVIRFVVVAVASSEVKVFVPSESVIVRAPKSAVIPPVVTAKP